MSEFVAKKNSSNALDVKGNYKLKHLKQQKVF